MEYKVKDKFNKLELYETIANLYEHKGDYNRTYHLIANYYSNKADELYYTLYR